MYVFIFIFIFQDLIIYIVYDLFFTKLIMQNTSASEGTRWQLEELNMDDFFGSTYNWMNLFFAF